MKRFKEKIKAIWYIIKGGQYAVYVINDGYKVGVKSQKRVVVLFQIMLLIYF